MRLNVSNSRQRARTSALASCVLLLLLSRPAHAQLDVDRLEVFVGSARDQAATFLVRNTTSEPVSARLSVSDWERSRTGTNSFGAPGTVVGACSNAVTVFPTTANLGPGESQVVQVSYQGPPRTEMCWSAIIVAGQPPPTPRTAGAGLAVEVRSAVKVYVAPAEERLDVRIMTLDVGRHRPHSGEPASDTLSYDIITALRNHGNVQVRAKLRVEYRNLADSLIQEVRDNDVPLLPGAEREWRSRIPAIPPGRYVILVVVDFGGAELVAGQIELELTP